MQKFLKAIRSFFYLTKQDLIILSAISLFVLVFDLATKHIIFQNIGDELKILPFLSFVKVYNYGVSFGMFHENPEIMFYVILICDISISLYLLSYFKEKNNYTKPLLLSVALSFIIGGALGNFVDRILIGSVRDFIDVYVNNHHWPCFNVADCFVCIGVFIWVICEIFFVNKKKKRK